MLVSYISACLLTISSALTVQARYIDYSAASTAALFRRDDASGCRNMNTNFAETTEGWVLQKGSSEETYGITPEGLEMRILKPKEYETSYEAAIDNDTPNKLRYNKYEGKGFTFNATTYMQYGKFSASVKSAKVPGAVTAVILIADNGDEIDFELLAGPAQQITSNYFYGPHIVYGENGDVIDAPKGNVYDQFYKYSIEWSPEKIVWKIDDKEIRTVTLEETDPKDGSEPAYPTHAARVQIGLWDGSGASGTAEWARGPIDWSKQDGPVTAYIKNVVIECDPQHN
ncbi:glycoside hydrolase family 16 protein [Mucor ambiguus]|uniref:Glycoside hydrolase family 16 protein n=1 Tax=Mucor ambiguus TaxID=91626 RepID=A0A0C9LUM0_9FUNG|nr:glycoside hydrolase family 16 protein [Mucor ambiguus]